MKNVLIIGAVVILALLGIYFFMQDDSMTDDADMNDANEEMTDTDGDGTPDADENENGAAGGENIDGTANAIVLAENETGNMVTIASATLTQQGFVALYKVNSNGATTLVGNTDVLEAGTHANIDVQANTVIAEGETIVGVLHADDGDGEFEFPETDFYLAQGSSVVVADVDVVDVAPADEAAELQGQVEAFLETQAEAEAQ